MAEKPDHELKAEAEAEYKRLETEGASPAPPPTIADQTTQIAVMEAEEGGANQHLNAILATLRAIDEQIPSNAKLPGSPNLTDQMAHLLVKYNEQTTQIEAMEKAAQEAVDWHTAQRSYHVTIMKLRDLLDGIAQQDERGTK